MSPRTTSYYNNQGLTPDPTSYYNNQGLTPDLSHICQAIVEMNEGLIDADLGAGLFKKRIAMPGQGKRGGWRSLLGFQAGNKAFFLYLFPKSRRDNIDAAEMKALKRLTKYYLTLKHAEIKAALQCGELREVNCSEKRT